MGCGDWGVAFLLLSFSCGSAIMDPKGVDSVTKLEYELLNYIRIEGTPKWTTVLNAFDPQLQAVTVDSLLQNLLEKELIRKTDIISKPPHCQVELTPCGLSVCLEYLESTAQTNVDHEEHQRDEAQKRKINWKAIIGAIAGLLGIAASIATILDFVMR